MTDYYVSNSPAGDDTTGLSKATAFLTLEQVDAVAGTTDRVLVSHLHSENPGASVSYGFSGTFDAPFEIISINYTGDAQTAGASISPTGTAVDISLWGRFVYHYGMEYLGGDDLNMLVSDGFVMYDTCNVGSNRTTAVGQLAIGSSTGNVAEFYNCTFDFNHSGQSIVFANAAAFKSVGGSLVNAVDNFLRFGTANRYYSADIAGMDLSNATNIVEVVSGGVSTAAIVSVRGSKLKSGYGFINGDFSAYAYGYAEMYNCEVGTITTAPYVQEHVDTHGLSKTTTARYRTGGADDGEQANAVSQEVTALASSTSKRITPTRFRVGSYSVVNGVSTEFKVHVAHNAVGSGTAGALQDDEFWIDIIGPSEKATSDAQAEYLSNKIAYNATATDLPLETGETWNGTNVGTKQSDSITYTPEIEGFVEVWANFATGSVSDVVINVDPKIEAS